MLIMEKLQEEDRIVVVSGSIMLIIIAVFIIIHAQSIIRPLDQYESFPSVEGKRMLIIAPHPDDEVAMAGTLLIGHDPRLVSILYITDGSYFQNPLIHRIYSRQRVREAGNAMGSLGIRDIEFLGLKDQHMIYSEADLMTAYNAIRRRISDYDPEIIIVPAYEGGHCVHDIANFMVGRIVSEIEYDGSAYEVALYNDYYSLNTPRKTMSRILGITGIRLNYPAMFLPKIIQEYNDTIYVIRANRSIASDRLRILEYYRSQNIEGNLVRKFSHSESIRELKGHDYSRAPYERKDSLDYYYCMLTSLFRKGRCSRISICQATFEDYKNAMVMIDENRI